MDDSFDWELHAIFGKKINADGTVAESPAGAFSLPVPKCIRDKTHFLQAGKGSGSNKTPLPAWTLKMGINRYLQMDYRVEDAPGSFTSSLVVSFNPAGQVAKEQDTTSIKMGVLDAASVEKDFYTAEIGVCRQ